MSAPRTIHALLCGRGPILDGVETKEGAPRCGPNWPDIRPSDVSQWEDFTFRSLRHAFGDILGEEAPSDGPDASVHPPNSYPIRNTLDVQRMAAGHLRHVLRVPHVPHIPGAVILLQRLRDHLRPITIGHDVYMDTGCRPPLGIFFDGEPHTWLVPGTARTSRTWHSRSLAVERPSAADLFPIRQLARYARDSGTPYAFIVSEMELVVVRFFFVENTERRRLGAEWKAISWDTGGSNILTANLAIWSLVMMSLNRHHREVKDRDQTLPVNAWYVQGGPGEVAYFEHPIASRISNSLPDHGKDIGPRPV